MTKNPPLSVEEQLDIAGALIVRSRVLFDAWLLSAGVKGRADYRPFWDEFWSFWRFNEHALLYSFIVQMAGLFETRDGTVNLHQIRRQALTDGRTRDVAPQLDGLFSEAAPCAQGLTIVRSNALAHRSASLSYNDAFKKAQITPDAMRELTVRALSIVNALRAPLNLEVLEFDELAIGDLRAIAKPR